MKILIKINEENKVIGFARIGELENSIEIEMTDEVFLDFEKNFMNYIYIDEKLTRIPDRPSDYHVWDSKTNKWVYDKELEINGLNDEIANLESVLLSKYDELDKAIARKLKALEKRLNAEIEELTALIDEKYLKLEELEG